MAVDTREKRQTAGCLLMPWMPVGVNPGTHDQAERQAAVWVYAGILASAFVPTVTVVRFTAEAVALAAFTTEAMALAVFAEEDVALAEFADENLEN